MIKKALYNVVFLSLIVILTTQAVFSQMPDSCFSPGNLVVSDADEALTTQFDIQSVSIAEPFFTDGSDKFVITLKVKDLFPTLSGSWNVFIKGQDNIERFVQFSNLAGTPEFRYGTVTFSNGMPQFAYQGDIQGSFFNDGNIIFIVDKSSVGNPAISELLTISARTYFKPVLDLIEIDQTNIGTYTVLGNAACAPFLYVDWGMAGDIPVPGNYIRNGATDFAVWRPSNGTYYVLDSQEYQFLFKTWGDGNMGDIPVVGDFDTDGLADWSYFRPSTQNWNIYLRSNDKVRVENFGVASDIPLAGDFDGDRIDDIAIWSPSTGVWKITLSSDGSIEAHTLGDSDDTPLVGDFDGDRVSDIGVFQPTTGNWKVRNSSTAGITNFTLGVANDEVVPADYDGDGKTDYAIWRPSNGTWYIHQSGDSSLVTHAWGNSGDIVAPGDYNGNGRSDLTLWRPTEGKWYVFFN